MQRLLLIFFIFHASLTFADLKVKIEEATANYLSKHFLNATFMFADEENVLQMGAKGVFSTNGEQLKVTQKMPIASSTKPITAAAILKLQDQKLLNVNDKIIKYLNKNSGTWENDKAPEWAKKITIHNLLTHTSGLAEYFGNLKFDPTTMSHQEINKSIINFAANTPLNATPGQKYKYTNTNFVILGLIIENISGKTLAEFYKKEFFDPLGMNDTHLASLAEALEMQNQPDNTPYPHRYFVVPNNSNKPTFAPATVNFILVPYADGGIISTPKDLITWQRALHNGKVLSDKSYKLMTKRYFKVPDKTGRKSYIGYGMLISELEGEDVMLHHPGSAVAIRSECGYIPNKSLYFAILSNIMVNIPNEIKNNIDSTKPENQLDIFYFREAILRAIH